MQSWLTLAALLWTAPLAAQTALVAARGETVPVGTVNEDAADDPAIWRNTRQPSKSLIVATDKKAGLYVYGLDGQIKGFVAAGRVNNVALTDMGKAGVIVAASDRNDEERALVQLYRLDTGTGALSTLGSVEGGSGEAYGLCLWREGSVLNAYSVLKQGTIAHVRVEFAEHPVGTIVRQLQLSTQTEGCVVDGRSKTLYVGEEARGVWAFDARSTGAVTGRLVIEAEGQQLVADVEGLAIKTLGRRAGWLIVSSQGDNAFAVYSLPDHRPLGRFRIGAGAFGSVEETDGIDFHAGSFGRNYPGGLFVAQDGRNEPAAQNFKLVAWRDILRVLTPLTGDQPE